MTTANRSSQPSGNPPAKPAGRMGRWLKAAWLCFWAAVDTLVFFIPVCLAGAFGKSGNLAFTLTRGYAWFILRMAGVRVNVRGKEHYGKKKSYVIISNHQSHFDAPALAFGLGIQFRWIAKQELHKVPLFGQALKASGNIFIDRSSGRAAVRSIVDGVKALPRGVSVMVFAEGTRSINGRIAPFKKGGFVAALENGLPILPVTICGSAGLLPKKSLVFSPGTIDIIVDKPIPTTGYAPDQLDELIRQTRDVVMANFYPSNKAIARR